MACRNRNEKKNSKNRGGKKTKAANATAEDSTEEATANGKTYLHKTATAEVTSKENIPCRKVNLPL